MVQPRSKDRSTEVLAFAQRNAAIVADHAGVLGDIVISVTTASLPRCDWLCVSAYHSEWGAIPKSWPPV